MLLWAPRLSTHVNGRTETPGEDVGAGLRGRRPEGVAGRARPGSLCPGARTADVRDRYAPALPERLVAPRRPHCGRGDRHYRPRAPPAPAIRPPSRPPR